MILDSMSLHSVFCLIALLGCYKPSQFIVQLDPSVDQSKRDSKSTSQEIVLSMGCTCNQLELESVRLSDSHCSMLQRRNKRDATFS